MWCPKRVQVKLEEGAVRVVIVIALPWTNPLASLKTNIHDNLLYTHYNPHNVHIRIKCGTTEAIALYRFILLSSVTNVYNY